MAPPSRKKEPKEAVSYTFQKRKAAPFIPQRPSKLPHIEQTTQASARTGVNASSGKARGLDKPLIRTKSASNDTRAQIPSRGISPSRSIESLSSDASLDEQLLADEPPAPRNAHPSTKAANTRPAKHLATTHIRAPSPLESLASIGSSPADAIPAAALGNASLREPRQESGEQTRLPVSTASSTTIGVHQPLLLRILHERFRSVDTKIDQHAIGVLQKYFEIFIREAIARTALAKQKAVQDGRAAVEDQDWLEVEDLEKVAAGMILDF